MHAFIAVLKLYEVNQHTGPVFVDVDRDVALRNARAWCEAANQRYAQERPNAASRCTWVVYDCELNPSTDEPKAFRKGYQNPMR